MAFFDFHSQTIHFKTFGVAKKHMFLTLIIASSIHPLVYVYRLTPKNTQTREADWPSCPNLLKNSEIDACLTCNSMQWFTILSKNIYLNWSHITNINYHISKSTHYTLNIVCNRLYEGPNLKWLCKAHISNWMHTQKKSDRNANWTEHAPILGFVTWSC